MQFRGHKIGGVVNILRPVVPEQGRQRRQNRLAFARQGPVVVRGFNEAQELGQRRSRHQQLAAAMGNANHECERIHHHAPQAAPFGEREQPLRKIGSGLELPLGRQQAHPATGKGFHFAPGAMVHVQHLGIVKGQAVLLPRLFGLVDETVFNQPRDAKRGKKAHDAGEIPASGVVASLIHREQRRMRVERQLRRDAVGRGIDIHPANLRQCRHILNRRAGRAARSLVLQLPRQHIGNGRWRAVAVVVGGFLHPTLRHGLGT